MQKIYVSKIEDDMIKTFGMDNEGGSLPAALKNGAKVVAIFPADGMMAIVIEDNPKIAPKSPKLMPPKPAWDSHQDAKPVAKVTPGDENPYDKE